MLVGVLAVSPINAAVSAGSEWVLGRFGVQVAWATFGMPAGVLT